MAKKNKEKDIEINTYIEYNGNWNRRDGEKVIGKAIAITDIDGDKIVLKHNEIGEIIEKHVQADKENIRMINNPNIDTGNITKSEKTFKEKIMQYLQTGLDAWM